MKKTKRVKDDKDKLKNNLDKINNISKNLYSKEELDIYLRNLNKTYNKSYKNTFNYNLINYRTSADNLENNIIKKININKEINNLEDLIDLINENPIQSNIKYNINIEILNKIKNELVTLNNMIGLNYIKNNIINQILYYIQNLHSFDKNHSDFMHIVLYGPPGTGKTEIAKIIGTIFANINILKSNKFKKVTRADLIAGYLGQTALKTKNVIEESLDGVLFIDEAYALGNPEKRDSFSKECIDTLCEALTDYKSRLMVIIAGYEDELEKCFFNYNPGLQSRFIWRYKTDDYNAIELMQIFIKKIKEINWDIDIENKILEDWFESHKKYLKYYGRSIETLLTKTKISHSTRIFGDTNKNNIKKLNLVDLKKGFKLMDLEKIENNDYLYSLYR
tara:strand:+ start:538 stop:1713 length:1176 start_codon:yes stop_codon:yes gene_type:complete